MICNMTPIPLVFSHHIGSCVPPRDPPFPPRRALTLTPVANGAAVKRGPVATTDIRDHSRLSFFWILTCLMIWWLKRNCPFLSILWVLTAARLQWLYEYLSGNVHIHWLVTVLHNQPARDEYLIKTVSNNHTAMFDMLAVCTDWVSQHFTELSLLLMKVKLN